MAWAARGVIALGCWGARKESCFGLGVCVLRFHPPIVPLTPRSSSTIFPRLLSKTMRRLLNHCISQIPPFVSSVPMDLTIKEAFLQTPRRSSKSLVATPSNLKQNVSHQGHHDDEDEDEEEDIGVPIFLKTGERSEVHDKISVHTALLRVQSSSSSSSSLLPSQPVLLPSPSSSPAAPLSGKKRPPSSVSAEILALTPSAKRSKTSLPSTTPSRPSFQTPSTLPTSEKTLSAPPTSSIRPSGDVSLLFSSSSSRVPFSKTPSESTSPSNKTDQRSGSSGLLPTPSKKFTGIDSASIFSFLSGRR